jgi:hypothetical protein
VIQKAPSFGARPRGERLGEDGGKREGGGRTEHAAVLGARGSGGHAQQGSPATWRRGICSVAGRGGPVRARRRGCFVRRERDAGGAVDVSRGCGAGFVVYQSRGGRRKLPSCVCPSSV